MQMQPIGLSRLENHKKGTDIANAMFNIFGSHKKVAYQGLSAHEGKNIDL